MSTLRRTLLVALASLVLCAPPALARPAGLNDPTPAFSGKIDEDISHLFRLEPAGSTARDAALAQERYYSTYAPVAPARAAATTAATDTDGIAWLPFALTVLCALGIGLAAGSALHLAHVRRHGATPAM